MVIGKNAVPDPRIENIQAGWQKVSQPNKTGVRLHWAMSHKGVTVMDRLREASNVMCCKDARRTLLEELKKCDYCSTSYEEHQACRHRVARRSGEQARSCMRT